MPKHAYLSASASHRWLACPPSAKLCANIADQTSEYAQQGTDCHELCAYLVEKALGRAVTDPTESLTFYDAEMQNCAEEYRNYVLEQIEDVYKRQINLLLILPYLLNGLNKWCFQISIRIRTNLFSI